MTRAEVMLWRELRAGRFHGFKFRRQVPVGPYIADFVCLAARIIVELDGPPHEDPEQRMRDEWRDGWLQAQGFTVLRFANDLVLGNADLALRSIHSALVPSPDLR